MKTDAAMTSHMTIHGNAVPGSGAKMKLTNGPVTVAKMSLTFWSMVIASWALAVPAMPVAAIANSMIFLKFIMIVSSVDDGHGHGSVHDQVGSGAAKDPLGEPAFR